MRPVMNECATRMLRAALLMFTQKHNPGPKTHKLRQSRKG